MSFQIERGLFLFDFIDQHAVLGVPIDADTQSIRKRYLKIARRLHPDSCASESEADKERASQFLSKLVNPAWEKLSQEKDRVEYDLIIKLKAKQAAKQESLELGGLGKELMAASNPDHFYRASIKSLAEKQFEHLDQALELIGQISELNMVYLMRKDGQPVTGATPTKKPIYTGSNLPDSSQTPIKPTATQASSTTQAQQETVTEQYCRRAEGYAKKNNFAKAVLELRDALQMDPRSSRCHALLGSIYLRQNQVTMARIHLDKALEIDPQNETALAGKQQLELKKTGSKPAPPTAQGGKTGATTSGQKPNPKPNKPNDKSGGGLFGLFGGKKK